MHPVGNVSNMKHPSFFQEFRERAGFVFAIAAINPVILTVYIMFWHRGVGALEFWLVGMGLTFLVCLASGLFMILVISADRRRRFKELRRKDMWEGVMPYDARKAKVEKAAEAG
jgi:ABC-type Fe3+-siderophore transport system permease subunit